ncbi:dihydroorotate dehydrogenase [Candidatus Aerophobetes bacterium]|nr:dihydroorotate dehydrogenase [Candidatus Aerophobetes bacterium]
MDKFNVELAATIGRVKLKNPVLVAAGTFGYGEEYAKYVDLNKLGGLIAKTITLKPRKGNPPPRLTETPAGLLNSIGLENSGIDSFIEKNLPFLHNLKTALIVSIAGENEEDYLRLADRLGKEKCIHALEVNVSCPNVNSGSKMIGEEPELVFSLTRRLKEVSGLPFFIKLSAQIGRMVELSQAAREAGAEAVSLINSIPAMAIDVDKMCPKLGNVVGGLSGPAIRAIAVKIVWEVHSKVDIPIIGMGGIMSLEDALEFVLAGASAVAVGTANFIDPQVSLKIIDELEHYLYEKKIRSFSELVGKLKTGG